MLGFVTTIKNKVQDTAGKAGYTLMQKKPEIALAAGLACGAAAIIFACKETLSAQEIIEEHRKKMDEIHEAEKVADEGEYTDVQKGKDIAVACTQTGAKLAKNYIPAAGFAMASVGLILYSHRIMVGRNVALAAAYATVDKSFKDYRASVREELGEDIDRHFRYGTKTEEVEEEVTDDKGKTKKVKKEVERPTHLSDYAKFFDQSNPNWEKNPEFNLFFLKRVERCATQKLQARKYLFLNEVYEALGIEPTIAGQSVGWIFDEEHPEQNYVDFGLYNPVSEANRRFVNGYEDCILLDFNVYGDILHGNKAGLGAI